MEYNIVGIGHKYQENLENLNASLETEHGFITKWNCRWHNR